MVVYYTYTLSPASNGDWSFGPCTNGPSQKQSSQKLTVKPKVDFLEKEDSYTLHVELPGTKKQDINVVIEKDLLTITAERQKESITIGQEEFEHVSTGEGSLSEKQADTSTQETKQDAKVNYHLNERKHDRYERVFQLPDTLDTQRKPKSSFEDGVLELTFAKKEEAKPVKISL